MLVPLKLNGCKISSGLFMEPLEDRPSTIHTDEALAAKGPWKFLIRAMPGGFSFWGIQLILAWVSFQALTALSWTVHLSARLGNSSLANNWGEMLTARDIWEIMGNGGLQDSILGFWTVAIGIMALLWALWAGWKVQAGTVGLRATFLPWLVALPAALALGYLPLLALHTALWKPLAFLSDLGIQSAGWLNLFASPLFRMAFVSGLLLQWWLCRIDLAHRMPHGYREWLEHLKDSFLRLWAYPIQWGSMVFFGVLIRTGLVFCVLLLAWNWDGQTLPRVWAFFFLQVTVAAINAWIIGWTLRVTALYWINDMEVRSEVRALESSSKRNPKR